MTSELQPRAEHRTRSIQPKEPPPSAPLRAIVLCEGELLSFALPRPGEVLIGRGADAGIQIKQGSVSRRHARLLLGQEIRIVDLGSFNGSRIGGRRLGPHIPEPLGLATIVELGEAMLVIQLDDDPIARSRSPSRPEPRLGLSEPMRHLYRVVDHIAESNLSVVIRGETGSGKEVAAEEIHLRSGRSDGPLVRLNCAALPEQLLEGELFGYERGAFTGASAAKAGLIESADGGTLFLDEIGEVPLSTQSKLLRVLESREVQRLGSVRPRKIDVRIIAATHRDLEALVAVGTFRQDLYYRLNGVTVKVPALRERPQDIPHLVKELVARFCKESRRPILPVSDAALRVLAAYPWPGNVRELRNVVERAIVFCKSIVIEPEHLGLFTVAREPGVDARLVSTLPPGLAEEAAPVVLPTSASPGIIKGGLFAELDAMERERVLAVLDQCHGNQTLAARQLGISRRTLLRRLDAYEVRRPRKG